MNIEKRLELTKKLYLENLKRNKKWYGLSEEQYGTAIKFIESYVHYVKWTLKFDNEEEIKND